MKKFMFLLVAVVAALVALAFAPTLLIPAAICGVAVAAVALTPAVKRRGLVSAINIAEGTHAGSLTKKTDAAIATRFLLVKFGTDVNHIAVNGANDKPLGICPDEAAAAEEDKAVDLLGVAKSTLRCVASEAIAITDELYSAAGGKVQNLPAGAGTYYKVGRPLQAAGADGDVLEFEPCFPVAVVVS
jgi:hypothetical protein